MQRRTLQQAFHAVFSAPQTEHPKLIKPKRLQKGDTIGIIAPCYSVDRDRMEAASKNITAAGFRVRYAEHLFDGGWEYAADIASRAADFHSMIQDPEIAMVLFGGGEVCNELLPYLDYEEIPFHPKILCSYSDSTTLLNAITSMTGLVTFYGASPRTFMGEGSGITDYNFASFCARMMEPDNRLHIPAAPWRMITSEVGNASSQHDTICEGILTGGYLVNYTALCGLPWFCLDDRESYLLFIEDHEMFSSPAVVAKWFATLSQHGVFSRTKALIFGHYAAKPYPIIDDILRRIGDEYHIPVFRCEDFGHGENNAVLPIGIRAALDTQNGTLTFLESGVL